MSTIFDVAKKAGVSVITVSRFLNNPKIVSAKTTDKILNAMEELHYQPSQIARSLVKKKTNTIGVIIPDIKNTFFSNWFRYIEDYATSNDYNLLLCNTDEDPVKEMKYVKLLQSQRVDGVIIVPCSKRAIEYLIKSHISFVQVDRLYNELDTYCVTTDHYSGAYQATQYLLKLGHKKLAVLKGPGVLYPDIERYSGFEDAMKKNNLEVDEDLVMNCEFNEQLAYDAATGLMKRKQKPTAIFSFNSLMTIGCIRAIQDMKLSIPQNISLLGFDEIPGYEIINPKITHVLQPIKSLGKETVISMIELIKGKSTSKKNRIFLKPKLIIADSCKEL
jgi:LacI family transcriptional regulator